MFCNLDYYDGDWLEDTFHGLGDYYSQDGAFYRGYFEYDQKTEGEITESWGEKYSG